MEPVLNELSIEPLPVGADLDARMSALAATLKRLFEHGLTRVLRTVQGIFERTVGPGMTLREWLFSGARGAIRETKQYLRSLLGKAPFVEDLHAEQEGQQKKLFEVRLGDDPASGLGVAMLRDAPAVSLSGNPRFGGPLVGVRVIVVGEDGEDQQDADVIHAASTSHVDHHQDWLVERIQRDVRSGKDLWSRRSTLFPCVDFCERVERDLQGMSGSEPYFQEIIRHLLAMSRGAATWTEGDLDLPRIDWSHESAETLKHSSYGPMRTFVCPDGVPREFSRHSKIRLGVQRIYFSPDPITRRVLVAYVGDHLPTVKYNH